VNVADGKEDSVKSMARKISASGANSAGSPAYWWARRYDLEAHLQRRLFYKNNLPVLFFSGSFAEFHWPVLHRCLHKVLLRGGLIADAHAVFPLAEGNTAVDHDAVHRILNAHVGLQNEVFTQRTEAWFRLVVEKGLEIKEHWRRYEFAKSRGTIHFHAIGWSDAVSESIHGAMSDALQLCAWKKLGSFAEHEVREDEAAAKINTLLPTVLGCAFTAEHPAKRQRTGTTFEQGRRSVWMDCRKTASCYCKTETERRQRFLDTWNVQHALVQVLRHTPELRDAALCSENAAMAAVVRGDFVAEEVGAAMVELVEASIVHSTRGGEMQTADIDVGTFYDSFLR
jgi:hypothetical protein